MLCFPEICKTLKVHTSNRGIVIIMTSNILWAGSTVYISERLKVFTDEITDC